MKKFKVGFDIDDVFLHTYQALHAVCVKEGLAPESPMPTTWSPFEEYDCTQEQWVETLNKAAREGYLYRDIQPDEDALRALRQLYWDGHEIHLITARGFMGEADIVAEHTEGWLIEYAVPHHTLSYSRTKGLDAGRLELDYFIDDNLRNWEEVRIAGTASYLLDRPWNRVAFTEYRVGTVQEYVDIIKEAASE